MISVGLLVASEYAMLAWLKPRDAKERSMMMQQSYILSIQLANWCHSTIDELKKRVRQ